MAKHGHIHTRVNAHSEGTVSHIDKGYMGGHLAARCRLLLSLLRPIAAAKNFI